MTGRRMHLVGGEIGINLASRPEDLTETGMLGVRIYIADIEELEAIAERQNKWYSIWS